MNDINFTPPPPRPRPEPLPTLTLPWDMVTSRQQLGGDNLTNWLKTGVRWDAVSRKRIPEMLEAYHIGHSRQGHTIFWQIDEQNRVRTGKMMKYRPDGHRDKESHWNFDFIHATLSRRKGADGRPTNEGPWPYPQLYNPDKQEMRQTLFGMHLLTAYGRNATVNIVESEKTALLMSIAYGNHAGQVWMACGGLENLSRERLAPIIDRHRKIVLYPDRDGVQKWRIKAEQLHYDRLSVNAEPVLSWWKPEDGPKADIADVVIRIINGSKPITSVGDAIEKHPNIRPIADNIDLEIEKDEDQ